MPSRQLESGQRCEVRVHDTGSGRDDLVLAEDNILLEAPNWSLDGAALIVNGNGALWRIDLASPGLEPIPIDGVPPVNNDHVLDPDGIHVFVSTNGDGQIHRAPLAGGKGVQVTGAASPEGMLHFLHGVSPDGEQLAFVGVTPDTDGSRFASTEICVIDADGGSFRQLTHAGVPADGPEYSPDGEWIYLNTQAFSGHAQIGRIRPDGTGLERLTDGASVDWFPHLAPDGRMAVYLAYPPGTEGHPKDKWVELMVVRDGDWMAPRSAARLFGGQGTINVNSWSPDSRRFAYVAYPMEEN